MLFLCSPAQSGDFPLYLPFPAGGWMVQLPQDRKGSGLIFLLQLPVLLGGEVPKLVVKLELLYSA